MRRIWMAVFCLALLFLTGGCKGRQEMAETEGVYQIYYLNSSGTKLLPTEYQAQSEDTAGLIEELTAQFIQVPADFDGQTALGEKVELQKCVLDGNVLYLYFDGNYMLMSSAREILCRASLAKVFTQIAGVDYISIYSGEQPIMDSNGTPVGMLTASDFVESISDVNTFEESELTLYFADSTGEYLKAEKRQVIHSMNTSLERLVVEQLIAGPAVEGLQATLLPDTKILNISVTDNVCYINFDAAFLNNTLDVKEYIPVYSIVNSLTENAGISRVQFTVNGANEGMLKEVFSINGAFERNVDLIGTD